MGYDIVNLKNMLNEVGEELTKDILSSYLCPKNADVEYFLHDRAVEFAKQGIAATHLVFTSYRNTPVLVGYFALANKYIIAPRKELSKTYQKRIRKFGTLQGNGYVISAPLIAQLGKNYANNCNELISGDELLKMAIDKVAQIQFDIGGRFVYLECEDIESLINFYTSNGFINFGKRILDSDEKCAVKGKYLIQMLKYIH